MNFITIGENIHCTRIYKTNGRFVRPVDEGFAIVFQSQGQKKLLRIPDCFLKSADWTDGKVKHCAVAAWQGMYGTDWDKAAAVDYIQFLAKRQESAGAAYLDINVDEFSTDVDERVKIIKWFAGVVQEASKLPLSIDSSNIDILKAGLEACDQSRGRPMINSISLERTDAIPLAVDFKAVVIASAAGETDLPSSTRGRLDNLAGLLPMLEKAGLKHEAVFIDPLVFPVATDSNNAQAFLDAVSAIREQYGSEIHISGGFSNVSFGMPNRKLINLVFSCMAVEAGADSGIVDPLHINQKAIEEANTGSEPFKLAKALLTGEDMFGAEYISAHREGRLG